MIEIIAVAVSIDYLVVQAHGANLLGRQYYVGFEWGYKDEKLS